MDTTTKRGCLTGAGAAAISGAVLLSTRAFGRDPLTGEVDEPRRKERAPVSPEAANEWSADRQSHCEVGKIRKAEGGCPRLGEVQLDGSVLCTRHAELLRLENYSERMLGEVFEMDQWLESVDGRADELRVRRAEHHRKDLVEQIRFNRMLTELIRDELLKDHDGTT
jgi:hypothetical protein